MAKSTTPKKATKRNEDASGCLQTKVIVSVLALSVLLVGSFIQLAINFSEKPRQETTAARQAHIAPSSGAHTLIVADNLDKGYLDHVIDALLKYGHKLTFRSSLTPAQSEDLDQFQLIWTHNYPFSHVTKLEPHQRINHFPGTGFITNKMTLSTTPKLPNVLKAFSLPRERDKFEAYARSGAKHKQLWIQKSSSHRGISIESAQTVNLEANNTLVQEYMSNPLLIDGKKFDIGIYAVLTSVQPLRVYIYEAEALLRFCAHPYYSAGDSSFNASDLDSYVVGDDYTPIWLMPSLVRNYIGTNMSMKQALNAYLRQHAHQHKAKAKGSNNVADYHGDNDHDDDAANPGNRIWRQIEQTIKHVYKSKEHYLARFARMLQQANKYNDTSEQRRGTLGQFFEMVRFDFIIDDQLNVYLMEANMSPNLSSRHFPPNRLIYEQVLHSYMRLAGLTQYEHAHMQPPYAEPSDTEQHRQLGLEAIVSDKDLSVYEDLCSSNECHMNCHDEQCKACYFCLSPDDKLHLRRAVYEQHTRMNFKRLLPSTHDADLQMQLAHPDDSARVELDSNYIHVQWFRGKCHTDPRFCSY